MANIYDKSSLVLIPSGTKTGKIFSQKPVSGDGDFTFTRASAATRVNADGNIEKETSNLLLQSNSFDTTWTSVNSGSVTGGQSGYDASSDAWLLTKAATNFSGIRQSISISGVHTFSVIAKAGTLNFLWVEEYIGASIYFDLINGTTSGSGEIASSMTSLGGGWWRCELSSASAITLVTLYPQATGSPSATAGNIYIQDAQLEQGLVARDYIETTTAAVYGGITDNTPRLDYTDSSCPALLLEPQRTNTIPYSEYQSGGGFTLGANITWNGFVESPEGYNNASRFTSSTTSASFVQANSVVIPAGDFTFSMWVRGVSGSFVNRSLYIPTHTGTQATMNEAPVAGEDWKLVYGSGTNTSGSSYVRTITLPFYDQPAGAVWEMYGFQCEAGSYATSYIPTYGSSVSRVFEPLTLFDFQENNLTTATAGTLMIHLLDYSENSIQFAFENDSNDSGFRIRFRDSDVIIYERIGGLNTEITNVSESAKSKKLALAWNGTNLLVSVNGITTSHTITSSAADGNNLKRLNSGSVYALVNKILAFPTQLTAAELNDLTTL
jgi:hypothetical protein